MQNDEDRRIAFEIAMQAQGDTSLDFTIRANAPHYDSKETRIAYFMWEENENDPEYKRYN